MSNHDETQVDAAFVQAIDLGEYREHFHREFRFAPYYSAGREWPDYEPAYRYGYDRYLEESGAQPVQRDEAGVLWRIELEGDEPLVMVEVVNSTPEPDGTHRTYWLRVPPRTRTAREGVAWTFGLDEAGYAPQRET